MGDGGTRISFDELIKQYSILQKNMVSDVNELASNSSSADPGKFLLLQFGMAQITQVGNSISNLIYQVNSMINSAVRNQKTG